MKLHQFDDPNPLFDTLLSSISDWVSAGGLVGTPTGSTPLPLYDRVRSSAEARTLWSTFRFLQLDEYLQLPPDSERFADYLKRELFDPLDIPQTQRLTIDPAPNGSPTELARSLDERYEREGAPDLIILGLGGNGHIAFNEPAPQFEQSYHSVHLCSTTVHRNFEQPGLEMTAITISVPQILAARRIVLVVPQAEKQSMLDRALEGPVSPQLPASALIQHPDLHVFRIPQR